MWREPAEESADLYPGLVVHDGRVTGSITAGRTRLPLWAFVPWVTQRGWGNIAEHYPSADEVGADGLASFLYNLLEMRGEFARLLLVLAEAHRRELNLPDEPLPPGWWESEELRAPVRDQLRRCLALLEA